MQPEVSVLIPVYNNPHTLRRAVSSALEQSDVRVQVLIIDDASTDDTWEVIEVLTSLDKGVNALRRVENGRIAAALNFGMPFTLGSYVIRLDSDDWFERGCLARLKAALDANPDVGFVYGQRRYYGRRSDTYIPKPFNRDDFHAHNAAGYCYMFRRDLWYQVSQWKALGKFDGAVIDLEDWQHLLALVEAGVNGLALTDTLVLHYTFGWSGTWQELKANEPAALAELKRRFPEVRAGEL